MDYSAFPASDPSDFLLPILHPDRDHWHSVRSQAPGPYFGPAECRFFRTRVLDDSPPHWRERQTAPSGTPRCGVRVWHPVTGPEGVPLPGTDRDGWIWGSGAVARVRRTWEAGRVAVGARTGRDGALHTFQAYIGGAQRFLWHVGGTREASEPIGRIRVDPDNRTAIVCERWVQGDAEWSRPAPGEWVHVASITRCPDSLVWEICG